MNLIKKLLILLLFAFLAIPSISSQTKNAHKPIRVVIAGMSHSHIVFILERAPKNDFEIVGVYDPDHELALRLSKKYGIKKKLVYDDMVKMFDAAKPEAVLAFGSVYDHHKVIEEAAPRGIHVMVEKPLATTVAQAERMQFLAEKHKIHLLTNYETSWYPSIYKAFDLIENENFIGDINKIIVNTGHQGPKEIGCEPWFLEWLTDPVKNGGGALFDFGCYGANLINVLMNNQLPISVTAVTRQYKPHYYPLVDDDATIIVSYPDADCVIQASWNWTFNRKDIEIYGDSGYIIAVDKNQMRLKNSNKIPEKNVMINSGETAVYEDPFTYFYDVIEGSITPSPHDLYSLENNVLVVKILEAALKSAKEQRTIYF